MSTPMQPVSIKGIGVYGVIREAEVDSRLTPDGAVLEAQNFHFDRKGAATVRLGITSLGATAVTTVTDPCVILFNAGSSVLLAGFFSTANGLLVKRYMGTADGWGSSTSAAANAGQVPKPRIVEFSGKAMLLTGLVNGSILVSTDVKYSSWVTSGAPLNPHLFASSAVTLNPTLGEVYKSRIYLAGERTFGSRLYFSSVIDSQGNITWTPATDFVDINPSDGEDITSIKRYSLELVVFKPNYTYRFRTSGLDPDPLIKIGTRSHESVIEGKKGLYFHHDTGCYRYSGGYPEEISRPVSDFINAIPYTEFANVSAWKDSDHIYFSIGNVTINEYKQNVLWRNVVLRYTESSDAWTIYSYPNRITRGATYTSPSQQLTTIGLDGGDAHTTNAGVIATLNSGVTDLGDPIRYRIITKWYEWEGIENQKNIQTIVSLCEKAQGSDLMYQVNEQTEWKTVGTIKSFLSFFRNQQIRFNRIRFKLTGVSRNEGSVFLGLEIPQGINEGIVTQTV